MPAMRRQSVPVKIGLCVNGRQLIINTIKTWKGISTMPGENDNKIESMETSFGSHSLDKEERVLRARQERARNLLMYELTKKIDHSRCDEGELSTVDKKERLDDFMKVDHPPTSLSCARVPIDHDGCGQIRNVITLD